MQPQLLCVITVRCVFLVWDPAKAHLLLLLLRTKQKKKWQLEEQFLSIKGYWEFNYLSCEVFQGCGQLIWVIMHRSRGHVHGAKGGGCCEVWKKSAKACFQIPALPRSAQLMRKSLGMHPTLFTSLLVRMTKVWMVNTWERWIDNNWRRWIFIYFFTVILMFEV